MKESCKDCTYCKTLYIPPVCDEPKLASGEPLYTLSGASVCSLFINDNEKWQIMWLENTDRQCEMFKRKKTKQCATCAYFCGDSTYKASWCEKLLFMAKADSCCGYWEE